MIIHLRFVFVGLFLCTFIDRLAYDDDFYLDLFFLYGLILSVWFVFGLFWLDLFYLRYVFILRYMFLSALVFGVGGSCSFVWISAKTVWILFFVSCGGGGGVDMITYRV